MQPNFVLEGHKGVDFLPIIAAPVLGLRDSDQKVPLRLLYVKGHLQESRREDYMPCRRSEEKTGRRVGGRGVFLLRR